MTKENVKPVLVLSVICVVVALLLSFVNAITAPIIEAAAAKALTEVLPDGKNFEEIIIDDSYPSPPAQAQKEGCSFQGDMAGNMFHPHYIPALSD